MSSFSLSVYRLTINKRQKKEQTENLSNFDNGKNLLKLVDSMFKSWKDEKDYNVFKDDEAKKARIYHCHQTYIDGIIESGDYGTQEDIIDIETGKAKYTKTTKDAALVPFYFMLYIEPNTCEGFLRLERIGNIGVFSVLEKSIRAYLVPLMNERLTLNIVPYIVPQILEMNLAAVGGAKKIVLKGVAKNQFKDMQIANNFAGCSTEVSFIAPKNNLSKR